MGLMDSLKHRFSTNMKVTQLMYMTQPTDIVRFCQSLSREDRADVVKGIESAFKWQPVGQIAQAFFPMQASAGAVVDAVDLAQGGYVSGAVDLMRAQSQNVQPQYGMTAMQQAALSYAWTVLKSMEKQEDMRTWNVPAPQVAVVPSPSTSIAVNFCPSCGRRREAAEKFCPQCGRPLGGQATVTTQPEEHLSPQQLSTSAGQASFSHTGGIAPPYPSTSRPNLGEEGQALFAQMASLVEQASQSGEVSDERAEALRSVLEQFQSTVGREATTPGELATQATVMRDIVSHYKSIYVQPKVTTDNRAGRVTQLFAETRGYLLDQGNRFNLGSLEHQAGVDLLLEAGHITKGLLDASDDNTVFQIEHDRIRPFLQAVRRFALRHHLTLAEPYWGWTRISPDPNRVFFAGGAQLQHQLDELCRVKKLQLSASRAAWGSAQSQWNALRECAVAVFDLTSAAQNDRSSVCHTLGSALALGVMPMVVSDPGSTMPFDLDVKPVSFNGDLSDALDRVLYSIPQVSGGSSLRETLQELLARCHSSGATTSVTARALANSDLRDSVEGVNGMELLALVNSDGRWGLLRPVWPGTYPASRQRRCFHVMPFGQPWSDGVRDVVCAACGDVAVYVRGDEAGDPRIIPSIWKEIGMATHVVVDMTGMNENVCLELALAQALGKKILLTMQSHEGSIRNLFPEVAKLQIRQYANETKLAAEVRNFVLV